MEDTPEYQAVVEEQEELREELSEAEERVDEAEGRADSAEADAERAAERTMAEAQEELDAQAAELDQRSTDLDAREAEITTAEAQFDASNLAPGYYIVGTDIQPGTYRTVGAVHGLCYVAQNRGNDIIWNDVSDAGQMIATVENAPGTVFEFNSDCGNMQRIG